MRIKMQYLTIKWLIKIVLNNSMTNRPAQVCLARPGTWRHLDWSTGRGWIGLGIDQLSGWQVVTGRLYAIGLDEDRHGALGTTRCVGVSTGRLDAIGSGSGWAGRDLAQRPFCHGDHWWRWRDLLGGGKDGDDGPSEARLCAGGWGVGDFAV